MRFSDTLFVFAFLTFPKNLLCRQNLRQQFLSQAETIDQFILDTLDPNGISCLISFLLNHLPFPAYLPIYLVDSVNTSRQTELVLQELMQTFPVYLLSNHLSSLGIYGDTENAIVLVDDYEKLRDCPAKFLDLCNSKCTVIAVLTTVHKSEKEFFDGAMRYVDLIWARRQANVVLVYRVEEDFFLARSMEFENNTPCRPVRPVSFGECREGWENWSGYLDRMLLNNCTLSVAYVPVPPFAMKSNESEGLLDGIEGSLLREMSLFLNFSVEFHEISPEFLNSRSNYTEYLKSLLKTNDLVLGGLIWSPVNEINYSFAHEVIPIIWLIPSSSRVTLRGFVAPFDFKVWIGIAVIFAAGVFNAIFITKQISLLQITSLFLGTAWFNQPHDLTNRLQFITWVLYGFFLTQFYVASMTGQLIDQSSNDMVTTTQLINSGLKYGGTSRVKSLFTRMIHADGGLEDDSYVFYKLVRDFIPFEPEIYAQRFEGLLSGKSNEYALAVMLNSSQDVPEFGPNVYMLKENLGSYPVAIAVRDGVSFMDELDMLIEMVRSHGIMEHFSNLYYDDRFKVEENEETIGKMVGIRHLIPGFMLLGIGYILALLALVGEVVVVKANGIKAKRKKKKGKY